MTDPAKDAERLADPFLAGARDELEVALRADIHAPEASWQTIKALFERLDRLTQERDEARRSAEALEDRLVGERVAGFRLAEHELTYHARKDSTGDETKEAFHCAANWLSKRAETLGAAQPIPDDVERARKIEGCDNTRGSGYTCFAWFDRHEPCAKCTKIAAALTAARREGAELRALDEAVIVAARAVNAAWIEFSEHGNYDARLITKLYARLDDLNAALAARDAAIGALAARPRDAAPAEESDE